MSARLLRKVLKEQEELQHHYSQSSTTEDEQDSVPSPPTASSVNPFDLLVDDEDDSPINPQQVSYFTPIYTLSFSCSWTLINRQKIGIWDFLNSVHHLIRSGKTRYLNYIYLTLKFDSLSGSLCYYVYPINKTKIHKK